MADFGNNPAGGQVYRQHVQVTFDYPVVFTEGVFDPDNPVLAQVLCELEPQRCQRVFAVVDDGLYRARPGLIDELRAYFAAHPGQLELAEAPRLVPGGEQIKNEPGVVQSLCADMQRLGIDRHSFCLALGGGAVLDAVGFAAAITHRGVRMLRMPTTVLSQNDSGVGVKNGINAFGAKNFLGTFSPPFAVINDQRMLSSLGKRDLRAGMAEAVKVALVRDGAFFEWMEEHREALGRFEPQAMGHMIRHAARIHMDHIAGGGDPFEHGNARPLDFGHWAAHKLEALTGHRLRHGEAVAIGMALDSRYALEVGMLPAQALDRICRLLQALGLRLWHEALDLQEPDGSPSVLPGLQEFREHLGGELSITLLRGIGDKVEVHSMDRAKLGLALSWLKSRDAAQCA